MYNKIIQLLDEDYIVIVGISIYAALIFNLGPR
jgi:hypothetical protein